MVCGLGGVPVVAGWVCWVSCAKTLALVAALAFGAKGSGFGVWGLGFVGDGVGAGGCVRGDCVGVVCEGVGTGGCVGAGGCVLC